MASTQPILTFKLFKGYKNKVIKEINKTISRFMAIVIKFVPVKFT